MRSSNPLTMCRSRPFFRFAVLLLGWVSLLAASTMCAEPARLPEAPSVADLFSARVLPEPLVPFGLTEPGVADNRALAITLNGFAARTRSDDFSALEAYLAANPTSPWRLAVLTNLGLLQYRAGYFSLCIPSYLAAWESGKAATEPKAKALADRAAGEYVKMLARLGRHDALVAFLATVKDRSFTGQSTELIRAGIEGSATMEMRPEIAFRCGPLALSRILVFQQSTRWADPAISESRSTAKGMSMAEVAEISQAVGLNYQVAKRAPGASFILPSVIHWGVGHYAALVKQEGARYLTEDPTFEDNTWHTLEALEAEASGYFLVPPGPLPSGWTPVSADESAQVFGKGYCTENNPNGNGDDDKQTGPDPSDPCGTQPMASYRFHIMLASLRITDTPVRYSPPYGPQVPFTLVYSQREAGQPSNFNFANLGPKWMFNWLTYIIDDPANPAYAAHALAGGSTALYTGFSATTQQFAPQTDTHHLLTRISTNPIRYQLTLPDGSREIYAQSDDATFNPRRVFLSQRFDPSGNAITLTYDAQLRITAIADAIGQQTTLSYTLPGDAFKITRVTDPFGRFASFNYDATGRLIKITDPIGIESAFTYSAGGDFIDSLTTPYGTTQFTSVDSAAGRRLTATDPAGDTEVLETLVDSGTRIPINAPAELMPQGMAVENGFLSYRNSFYWNNKQWKEAAGDYTKAHIYHFLHDTNLARVSRYLESEKPPLQSRTYYEYGGQVRPLFLGTGTIPLKTGQVIEGGTRLYQQTVNDFGNITSVTDPLGRLTTYTYSADGVDLLAVRQGVDHAYTATNIGGSATVSFSADPGAPGSSPYQFVHSIDRTGLATAAPESVYHTGRYGSDFSYVYAGYSPATAITVRLHFAETYFTTAGQRVFGVQLNGVTAFTGLDLLATAGFDRAVVREFPAAADAQGRITVRFVSTVENAIVSGIEILAPTAPGPATLAAYTYNSQHLPLTFTDAAGQTTTVTYNPVGQPLTVTNARGEVTTLAYYPADASGKQRRGRLSSLDGPLAGPADTTAFDYDAVGRVASVTGPDGYTLAYAYDAIDRLTRTTYPDDTYTETTYQALDPATSRDRLGRLTTTVYNSIRQLASVTDPAARTIQYKWCKCGDLQQLIDAMGRVTKWRHDVAGRVTAKEYTDGSKITYAYEPLAGRLASITDEKGQVKTYSYNLDDTLAGRAYTHEEHETPDVAYAYDPVFRRLVRMTDGIGATTYAYHPITTTPTLGAGRLAAVDGPWANDTITYAYDSLGRVASRAIDGVAETTSYDPAGRVGTITNALGAFTYAYDGATRRLLRSAHDDGVATEYTYYPNAQDRRLQRICNLKPDGTPLSVFDYTYDPQGRILTWKQQQDADAAQAQLWTLGYDDADQLTSNVITQAGNPLSTSIWTYDPAGNRLSETVDGVSTTARYNALNELVNTTAVLPATTYEWDAENRLIAINQGANRSEFGYDGWDRRVQTIEKSDGSLVSSKVYRWTGVNIRECRDGNGSVVQQRFFSQGAASFMGTLSGNLLYTRDHLGSIRETTDLNGGLMGRAAYDPWGTPSFSNATPQTDFAYTGYFLHRSSGLQMALYRVYGHLHGRWLSRDPIAELGGINLYNYVTNNPINLTDLTGLMACTPDRKNWPSLEFKQPLPNTNSEKKPIEKPIDWDNGIRYFQPPLNPNETNPDISERT